jgi:hypothetical protein
MIERVSAAGRIDESVVGEQMVALVWHVSNGKVDASVLVGLELSRLALSERSRKQATSRVIEAAKSRGCQITNVSSEIKRLGRDPAICVRFDETLPDGSRTDTRWHVIFPAGGRHFVVVCGTRASDFARFERDFQSIVESMHVEPRELSRWDTFSRSERIAVIGGAAAVALGITCLAWGVRHVQSKSSARPAKH